jgi:hypothetical protein
VIGVKQELSGLKKAIPCCLYGNILSNFSVKVKDLGNYKNQPQPTIWSLNNNINQRKVFKWLQNSRLEHKI